MKPLILLMGKSGSGKDYLVKTLLLSPVVSRTTRAPRAGEVDGISKQFMSCCDMDELLTSRREEVIAMGVFDGHIYCALEEDLEGCDVYIVDPFGAQMFILQNPEIKTCVVEVRAPWYRRLRRMVRRNREDGMSLTTSVRAAFRRLRHDRYHFNKYHLEPYSIINT